MSRSGVEEALGAPDDPLGRGGEAVRTRGAARVLIACAREDEEYRDALVRHLTALEQKGLVTVWHAGLVKVGAQHQAELRREVQRAEVVLLLVSAHFLVSEEAWGGELLSAIEQREAHGKVIVPILVQPVVMSPVLAGLQVLPRNGRAISTNAHEDEAWTEVVSALRDMLESVEDERSVGLPPGEQRFRWAGRLGEGRGQGMVGRVARIARLRSPDARVTEHDAPEPFQGLVVVTEETGRHTKIEPIAVLDGPMSANALQVLLDAVLASYRKERPLLNGRVVHTGDPATKELSKRALQAGVELDIFAEYQSIVDFERYLRAQTARVDRDPSYPEHLYVEQRAELRIRLDREESDDILSRLVELLSDPFARFILVLGDFGTGKTFLMRQLARRLAERHLRPPKNAPPPVLVEMRELEKSLGLDKLLAQHFQHPDAGRVPVDSFRYLLSEGRAALLFDGFDELAFRVTYDRVMEHFDTVLEAAQGKAKVVVTSRTAHFLNDKDVELALARKAAGAEGYRLIKLHAFDEGQIHRALVKRLGSAAEADRRMDLLRQVEDLMGLSANPRMLGFILEIPTLDLEEAKTRKGRITSATLYELLVTRWLEGEVARAKPKGAEPPLTLSQLWKAVSDLALLLWARTEKGIRIEEIPAELWASLQKIDPSRPLDVEHATSTAGSRSLLVRDDEGRFSFWHESILDWLVAKIAAAEVVEKGEAPALGQKAMSPLMADFFAAMASHEKAIAWARTALRGGSELAVANANLALKRLGVEAEEDLVIEVALDLSGHDLRGQDLSGTTHLRGAILEGADLTGATLVGADLSGADLTRAKLTGANGEKANLHDANLTGADLSLADLLGADLEGAQLVGSRLRYAKLLGAMGADLVEKGADSFGAAPSHPTAAEPATLGSLFQLITGLSVGLAISPDGLLLATGHGGGAVVLWDLASRRPLRVWGAHADQVTALAFSPDGLTLASASHDKTIRLWSTPSHSLLATLQGHSGWVTSVAFSPDGLTLASASDDTTIRLWSTPSHSLLATLQGHSGWVTSVAFSPDGLTLASASWDNTIRLWSTPSHSLLATLQGHSGWVTSVAFSPDGLTLASASEDTTIRLWSPPSHALLATLQGHSHRVTSVAFSPDGLTLASASGDTTIRLWSPPSHALLATLQGHSSSVTSVAFSPDGLTLASASGDTTIRLWSPPSHSLLATLQGHSSSVTSVAFSPDGLTLASASSDATIRLWSPPSHSLLATLQGHSHRVTSVAFFPDGLTLASASGDTTIRLWSPPSHALLATLQGHSDWVTSVAFSPDGLTLASASHDKTIRLWSPPSHALLATLQGHSSSVTSVAFSPDGLTLASASHDKTIRLWSPPSHALLATLQGHSSSVTSVAFSPDGLTLASTSYDTTIRLWSTPSHSLLATLQGHSSYVTSVAFSPDGLTLASASGDTTIRLWSTPSHSLLATLQGHSSYVTSVAFSPDGLTLASASGDDTIRLWRVADGVCLLVLVPAEQGWAAFTPDGRYKVKGDVGGRFWHVVGLCRFEPGELDAYTDAFTEHKPLHLEENEPFW